MSDKSGADEISKSGLIFIPNALSSVAGINTVLGTRSACSTAETCYESCDCQSVECTSQGTCSCQYAECSCESGECTCESCQNCEGKQIIYKTPYISSFSVTQTKVGETKARCSFNITNYDSGATYEIQGQDTSGHWWPKASGSVSGSGSATISFDNYGTYSVQLIVYNGTKSTSATRSVTLTNVEKWSWSKSNGRATASQTSSAYQAVLNNGKVSDFSYLVWNDLCSKVYAVRTAVGGIGSWDTAYGSYNEAQMTSSDRKLTAKRFNNLKNQIGSQIGTGINDVSKGDIIMGSYFITIANKINSWIDRL